MLQTIFNEMLLTLQERDGSTIYSGWGTAIDRLVDEYCEAGGDFRLILKLQDLAYYK